MAQIPNALIPCYVIQLNNTLFIQGDEIAGRVLDVPCKTDFIDDPDYWAVPIKDEGIFTTVQYIPQAESPTAPTFDSFQVFRVRDKLSGHFWYIYGNQQDFVSSCSTCCDDATIPMPQPANGVIPIAPCNLICEQNAAGQYTTVTALPALAAGESYFPYGAYNNVALPAASGAGYSSTAALLAFLNANWTNVGSPVATFVWTLSTDGITLTATGGFLGDSLCLFVAAIPPSV
jgi:hypothetical protein